jgi:hypothetical protein
VLVTFWAAIGDITYIEAHVGWGGGGTRRSGRREGGCKSSEFRDGQMSGVGSRPRAIGRARIRPGLPSSALS